MDKVSDTASLLVAGIKAEALRQKTIADNIANLETPGYRRGAVKFEELLAKALDSQGNVDMSEVEPVVYQPRNTPVNANGNDVNLETEVGEMVKNSLRHKTFVLLLHKKVKGLEAIIDVP